MNKIFTKAHKRKTGVQVRKFNNGNMSVLLKC